MQTPTSTRYQILIALMAGLLFGVASWFVMSTTNLNGGDFGWSLRAARDLLAGLDVYRHEPGPYAIPYPLPAALFAIPFSLLPDDIAAGLFFGLSVALLIWVQIRANEMWRFPMFLSWPFIYGLFFAQWPPLLLCIAYLPGLMPLVLIKPQIALPLVLTTRFSWPGVGLTVLVLIIAFIIYPTWPWVWLGQLSTYQGSLPPLLTLPLGPVLLLALWRYRERRAWLLLLMALMPQRMVYDQLALLLVAENRRELLFLVICSWLSLPALLIWDNWGYFPGGWQLWVILTTYLPALLVLLRPELMRWWNKNRMQRAGVAEK